MPWSFAIILVYFTFSVLLLYDNINLQCRLLSDKFISVDVQCHYLRNKINFEITTMVCVLCGFFSVKLN